MRLLIDINILMDVFTGRQPFYDESAALLSLVEEGGAAGFVAAHSVTTLYFLLARRVGREKAATTLHEVMGVYEVVPVDRNMILEALSLGWKDFEDAVQAVCAIRAEATHLVTRNTRDYGRLNFPVLEPFELLAQLDSEKWRN